MSREVGERLREMRTQSGISLTQVAVVLALEAGDVEQIEKGERYLSVFEMGVLQEKYGWDTRELLGMEKGVDTATRSI